MSVCSCDGNVFALRSWNFELEWIVLINLIAEFFPRHAWCTVSVFFCDRKCLLEVTRILSLWKYSWSIRLWIVFQRTHGVKLWWKNGAWGSWIFELVWILWINWIAYCFPRHAWCAVSVFVCDWKHLLDAVGLLSLWKCSWSIGMQIVFWGTHGLPCVFSFVVQHSCLRQLEFWACANIFYDFNLFAIIYASQYTKLEKWFYQDQVCFRDSANQYNKLEKWW